MGLQEEKKKLRRQILKLRDSLPLNEREMKSECIRQKLYQMIRYKQAESILAFVNYQSEVITLPLLEAAWQDNKKVYVPRVCKEEMDFYEIRTIEELQEGYKGILEPKAARERLYLPSKQQGEEAKLLMLMPGAVFDKNRHRIGYGKGFYDRYLAKNTENFHGMTTIALAFACQIVEEVPVQEHDVKPDRIITEDEIIE